MTVDDAIDSQFTSLKWIRMILSFLKFSDEVKLATMFTLSWNLSVVKSTVPIGRFAHGLEQLQHRWRVADYTNQIPVYVMWVTDEDYSFPGILVIYFITRQVN